MLHGLAALIELLAEPLYILTISRLRFRARGLLETAAHVAKGVAVLGCLHLLPDESPILAFSAGQLAFGTCVSSCREIKG